MMHKTALLIDSGTDVSDTLKAQPNLFVLPLRIIFSHGEFIDGKTINSTELFKYMETEIPSTSLPSGEDMIQTLQTIKDGGYDRVVAVTISSGLSGTHNFLRQILESFDGLESILIDTKNIAIGAGLIAEEAYRLIEADTPFDVLKERIEAFVPHSKIFFTVGTLEFLKKGGRIGLVAGTVAELLNVKPIISCNDEGIYYTVTKTRGRKRSHSVLIEQAVAVAKQAKGSYDYAIIYGNDVEGYEAIASELKQQLPDAGHVFALQVGPALAVHVGPDAFGIAVIQK